MILWFKKAILCWVTRGPSCGCSDRTLKCVGLSPHVVSYHSLFLPNYLMQQLGPKREHFKRMSTSIQVLI